MCQVVLPDPLPVYLTPPVVRIVVPMSRIRFCPQPEISYYPNLSIGSFFFWNLILYSTQIIL